MNDLDEAIKKYYASKALPEEKAEAILAQRSRGSRHSSAWFYRLAGIAAVLLVGFMGVHTQLERRGTMERVLAEIAMNHRKNLGVEVTSDQYQVVQEHLDRLDFPILPARRELIKNYSLVGGRYCSIQGELAAQLKVRERLSGETLTLYVTRLTEGLDGIVPLDEEVDGVYIRLWEENGRFFGLAGGRSE